MNVDTKKLRDQAERLLVGVARGDWFARETYVYQSSDARDHRQVCRVPTVARSHEVEPHAAFIAAANPKTVIKLLDEIERLRGYLAFNHTSGLPIRCRNCGTPIERETIAKSEWTPINNHSWHCGACATGQRTR